MMTKTAPIAITGMSCRFPGSVNSLERLWELCAAGRNTWSEWPKNRFNEKAFHHPQSERLGTIHSHGGHFLEEDVSLFDASFFNFTAEVAKAMDPQIRLLLETTFEAFESAGLSLAQVAGSPTSVFAGAVFRDYHDMLMKDAENLPRYFLPGNDSTMVANRISHFFDLRGPSMTVNTACSTSTTALHMACQSLRNGEAKMAVVGGANLLLCPATAVGLSTLGLTGASGRSYAFDERAEGYGRGEGVGCIVIKPLEAALRDGDPIRAVIRETGMNQDGNTPTITSPSQAAQEALIRSCYEKAGLEPKDTAYVEAHGTGTIAGDTIEVSAIGNIFSKGRSSEEPLLLGSIKANLGHLESTSGLAAIIKTVLMLEKRLIPPQALFEVPNRMIDFDGLKLKVPTKLMPWPDNKLRRISVNNFGAGGTNTHVIIEDVAYHLPGSEQSDTPQMIEGKDPRCNGIDTGIRNGATQSLRGPNSLLFTLSAKDESSCRAILQELGSYLNHVNDQEKSQDLAYTLAQRRSHFPWRIAISSQSISGLRDALKGADAVRTQSARVPRLGFVFTGQGAQWFAMGRELATAYPVYLKALDDADKHIKSLGALWSVLDELNKSEESSRLDQPFLSFPLTVILQIALVRLLATWGIVPAATTGHSSGEIAAAYAAGILTFEEAVTVAYIRGELTSLYVNSGQLKGGMTSLAVGKETAIEYIQELGSDAVVIACVNSPKSVTLSGDVASLEQVEERAQSDELFFRRLKVPAPYHSPQMQLLAHDYLSQLEPHLKKACGHHSQVLFASPVTGKLIQDAQSLRSARHWVQNMTQSVQFDEALRNLIIGGGPRNTPTPTVDIIIEIGPHAALQGPIRQILEHQELKDAKIPIESCLKRKQDSIQTMQELAGKLHCRGYPVHLENVNFPSGISGLRVLHDLPHYQWNHSIGYWAESQISQECLQRRHPRHDLLGVRVEGLCPEQAIWRNTIRAAELPWLYHHMLQSEILFPISGLTVMLIEAMRQLQTPDSEHAKDYVLSDINLFNGVVIPKTDDGLELQLVLRDPNKRLLGSTSGKDFTFYSRSAGGQWMEHCKGTIAPTDDEPESITDTDMATDVHPVDIEYFYQYFQSVGPTLGETFRNISSLALGAQTAIATVVIPNTASMMPFPYRCEYLVFLGILDSCFQVAWGTMPEQVMRELGLSLPRVAKSVTIRSTSNLHPGLELGVLASLLDVDNQGFEVSLSLYDTRDPKRMPIVKIDSFKIQSLSRRQISNEIDNTFFLGTEWEADISLLSEEDYLEELICQDKPKKNNGSEELVLSDPHGSEIEEQDGKIMTRKLQKYFALFAHKFPRARILEIGADIGSVSMAALDGLSKDGHTALKAERYDFTATSPEALQLAQKKLERFASQIRFQKLDIEQDPSKQGFGSAFYDLILVSNSFDAVNNLSKALKNVRRLLRPGGRILVLEATAAPTSKDPALESRPRRSEESENLPLLCSLSLASLLSKNGFNDPNLVLHETNSFDQPTHSIIVARTKEAQGDNANPYPTATGIVQLSAFEAVPQSWLHDLATSLSRKTCTCVSVEKLGSVSLRDKACIILAETNPQFLSSLDAEAFKKLQKTFQEAESILWVSRSATPDALLHTGLLRTLRVESGFKSYVSLDLDPNIEKWDPSSIQAICDAYCLAMKSGTLERGGDNELAQRSGRIMVPRLFGERPLNEELVNLEGHHLPREKHFSSSGPYLRLESQAPGLIDSLIFRQDDRLLDTVSWKEDMVEIIPIAFGLNFRDVLVAMGQMQEKWMGFECAGYVSRVGPQTDGNVKVGDRVCAFLPNGHWVNRVRTSWTNIAPISEDTTMEMAASIPMVFITAFHALINLAHLDSSDRILIHSAAGGVGQAAITIAQSIGAEVFVTVGSHDKRNFLTETYGIPQDHMFSSRDASFRDKIMQATEGKGVDVVLNSLAAELLHATWDCIAPFGRFIELGKKDAQMNNYLSMKQFSKSVSYIAMDTVQLALHKGKQFYNTFRKVMNMLEEKKLSHRIPIITYGIGELHKAFRLLQSGEQVGKIIVQFREGERISVITPHNPIQFSKQESYLIVGGLSGVGLAIAQWMAQQGAKHLILMSRNAEKSANEDTLLELRKAGTDVYVRSCDITNLENLHSVIHDCHTRVPIRGVIQAAAVLENASFNDMTLEKWQAAIRPKYDGSKNLDTVFQEYDLDFFLLLSSITGIMGNFGQANYTAGGTYQDALAHNRIKRGLPAVSIDLGSIPSLGLAARSGIGERLEKAGYRSLSRSELLRIIELAIRHPYHGQMVTGISSWTQPGDLGWRLEPRFACLWQSGGTDGVGAEKASPDSLRKRLADASSDLRGHILMESLKLRLGEMLMVSPADIDATKSLSAYGVDSLVAVELRTWLGINATPRVSVFDITQSGSLCNLVKRILEKIPAKLST